MVVVGAILLAVNFFTHKLFTIEMLAALAVFLSFAHTQVTDRMAEQEGLKEKPVVGCFKMMWYYFIGKEICWCLYFFLNHSYSALVGVIIFLCYPVWRSVYRSRIKSL